MTESRDPTFDVLLDLDGQVLVVDPNGGYWVRFIVTRVAPSPEKPHGIDYSLTLHGPDGERLTLHGPDGERLVFDNALLKQTSPPAPGTIARFIHQGARKRMRTHPVATQKRGEPQDHRHRLRTTRAYDYRDAATLVADFWSAVDGVLRERGVIR